MSENWSSAAEARRLAIIESYPLYRTDIAEQLDRIAKLAAELCETPIALVSLVEGDRQRFIGRTGIDETETPRNIAFCDIGRLMPDGMVVPDARLDARFRENPLVTGEMGIRLYASQPLHSLEGAPLGTLCVIDSKPREGLSIRQVEGLRTLATAVMAILERWRLDSASRAQAERSKSTIHDLEQRVSVLADAMPQMVWSSLATGHSDYFNSMWCNYTGAPASASYGSAWMTFLHPDDVEQTTRVWGEAVSAGTVYEIEYRLRGRDGEYRWMLARGLPMRDEQGEVYRWLGTCTDIHEQKLATERHELLTRELSHRIKNIFAVISGLITLSHRRRPELKELAGDLQQRVLALGRAHDFVRPHSDCASVQQTHSSLKGMLAGLLLPYEGHAADRVRIVGDDVRIDDRSATPLALFFHELATNAAKYGALSVEDGTVEIAIDSGPADFVSLTWTERGGPLIAGRSESGFGGNLIDMSVTRQLGGTLDYDWRDEGLRVQARIPVQMMSR